MPRNPTTREIEDDFGVSHTYTITPHPAEEGVELLPSVLRLIGEAAGPLIDSIQGAMAETIESPLNAKVNGEKIGKALSNLADELVRAGNAKFYKELLKHTTRTDDAGREQKVAQAFGAVYQGNYGELAKALVAVIEINFVPSLRAKLASENSFQKIASLMQRSE